MGDVIRLEDRRARLRPEAAVGDPVRAEFLFDLSSPFTYLAASKAPVELCHWLNAMGPPAPMYWICLPAFSAAFPAANVVTTVLPEPGSVTFTMKGLKAFGLVLLAAIAASAITLTPS